jgi:hypothetical protein
VARFSGGNYDGRIRPDKPLTLMQAATNATDNASLRVRADNRLAPVIYTIGLGDPTNPVSLDDDLLLRLANDPAASNYDSTKQVGLYVYAANNTQLTMAFYRIASEVLRIAR